MASIRERINSKGKVRYRAQIRLKGYPITTATFARKTDAKRWIQQTEVAMREKRYFKRKNAEKYTVINLIDRYIKSVLSQRSKNTSGIITQLDWWKRELGYCLLSDLTPSLIVEKRDVLLEGITYRGTKRAPATVVRYLAAFSHALSIAVKEWGWLEDNPMKRVTKPKEPRGRVRFLSDKEREKLLQTCRQSNNPYLYLVVVLALSTGMRQGEIMGLRWENINLDLGQIVLKETKNGDIRSVFVKGQILELIRRFKEERKQDFGLLFPSLRYKHRPANLKFSWSQALKASEIKDFRFHDMRHSAASYLAMSGATPSELAEVLGHRTLQMVKRYTHISEQHSAHILERMNKKFLVNLL